MHSLISKNPWSVGTIKLKKNDIVNSRRELDSIRCMRSKLRKAIMNSIVGHKDKSCNNRIGSEQDIRTAVWQRRTKHIENNFG